MNYKLGIAIACALSVFTFSSVANAKWTDNLKKYAQDKNVTKDQVIEKIENTLQGLHSSLIEAKKIGFIPDDVRVVSSIIPHVEVFFSDIGETGREQEILEANKGRKMLYPVLKFLNDTRRISVANYHIKRVKVNFTVPPKITIIANVDLP